MLFVSAIRQTCISVFVSHVVSPRLTRSQLVWRVLCKQLDNVTTRGRQRAIKTRRDCHFYERSIRNKQQTSSARHDIAVAVVSHHCTDLQVSVFWPNLARALSTFARCARHSCSFSSSDLNADPLGMIQEYYRSIMKISQLIHFIVTHATMHVSRIRNL